MKSSKNQIKRTLSLALAILLILTTPMASLATEEIPNEEEKIKTVVEEVEETEENEEKIFVKEKQDINEEENEETNPVVEEVEEDELLGASGDTIYWGISNGVLRLSVAKWGGEHSGRVSHSVPWYNYRNEITKVYVGDKSGTVKPTNMSEWFYNLSNLEEINFVNIDTSKVTDMYRLFKNCWKLESLDLSGFDTGNATDMREMFYNCNKLKTIYVGSGFSTENLENDDNMFYRCTFLFGMNGTRYSAKHTDSTYARVDDPLNGKSGYFTLRAADDDPDIHPFHPVRPTDPTSSSSSVTSSTNKWEYHSEGDYWTYTGNGLLKNTWAYIANPWNDNKPAWFFFDNDGKMLTGWQLLYWNGSYQYYYFHETSDGKKGECQLGGRTPDGYYVDATGAWIKNGAVQKYMVSNSETSGSSANMATNDMALNAKDVIGVRLFVPFATKQEEGLNPDHQEGSWAWNPIGIGLVAPTQLPYQDNRLAQYGPEQLTALKGAELGMIQTIN